MSISGNAGGISFLSTDGYVVVESGSDTFNIHSDIYQVLVRGEDLKKLLPELPTSEKEIEFVAEPGKIHFGSIAKIEMVPVEPFMAQFWVTVRRIIGETERHTSDEFDEFFLDNRRLQKFSLAEPRGEEVLKFVTAKTPVDTLAFKWTYGRYLRGILSPLDPERVFEKFPDELEMWRQ